jgi:hypothetical protein
MVIFTNAYRLGMENRTVRSYWVVPAMGKGRTRTFTKFCFQVLSVKILGRFPLERGRVTLLRHSQSSFITTHLCIANSLVRVLH